MQMAANYAAAEGETTMPAGRRSYVICEVMGAAIVIGMLGSLGAAVPSQAADPPTLRLGYGSAAEEQLYVLLAKPDLGKNNGKTYKLDASRFQSSTQRT